MPTESPKHQQNPSPRRKPGNGNGRSSWDPGSAEAPKDAAEIRQLSVQVENFGTASFRRASFCDGLCVCASLSIRIFLSVPHSVFLSFSLLGRSGNVEFEMSSETTSYGLEWTGLFDAFSLSVRRVPTLSRRPQCRISLY